MITVQMGVGDPGVERLWGFVGEVAAILPPGWVLIGGLMVQVHALEHGILDVRPTLDIDVLGEARPPGALPAIDASLRTAGFSPHEPDRDGYGHRYERDGLIVDVLAPDGIRPPPALGGGVTAVGVPGGSQAIQRAEVVTVELGESSFTIRRPSLLGAILIKARSLMVHDDPSSQREDLLRLLSLIPDPAVLRDDLRSTERTWLRRAEQRLDFLSPSLLDPGAQRPAELAFRLLTRP